MSSSEPAASENDNVAAHQYGSNKTANADGESRVRPAIELWRETISQLHGIAADCASDFHDAANFAPNRVVVTFLDSYNSSRLFCQKPDRHVEMEKTISQLAGVKLKLEFVTKEDGKKQISPTATVSPQKRLREAMQDPFVQRAMELFSAELRGVEGNK